ncbi:5-aminolevulinate synthase [Amycolatopsis sp. WAC 04182]|nr:5-aminolevulinate synthase [Amycolatopsis sp. WAC 04182]
MPTISVIRSTESTLDILKAKVEDLKQSGLYRQYIPCSYLAAEQGHALHAGRKIQVWCTNDYLGMSQHPDVIQAQIDSAELHGVGNGGSRNIAGTSEAHVQLEAELATWHGKERALVFTSGYVANFETLTTLASGIPDLVIFSDSLNHRSLIEGIRRSGGRKHIFPHNDLAALERALGEYELEHPKLIVFESVYSMDGDTAPVTAICDLAEKYNALTFVDETHAIGPNGPTGAGICEEVGEHRATFIQGVFGKAVGTTGGYVAGPDSALDYVRSHAPGFIFTTTIPRAVLDGTLKSLEVIRRDEGLRRDLRENVTYLKNALRAAGIEFLDAESHLVPVLVPGGDRVKKVSKRLLDEHDVYVQPVNFPSVPKGGERFRITVAPYRTHEQIDGFVSALGRCLSLED